MHARPEALGNEHCYVAVCSAVLIGRFVFLAHFWPRAHKVLRHLERCSAVYVPRDAFLRVRELLLCSFFFPIYACARAALVHEKEVNVMLVHGERYRPTREQDSVRYAAGAYGSREVRAKK